MALEELRKAEQLWPGASNLLARALPDSPALWRSPGSAVEFSAWAITAGSASGCFPPGQDRSVSSQHRKSHRQAPGMASELTASDWRVSPRCLGHSARKRELFQILLNWRHPNDVNCITEVLFPTGAPQFSPRSAHDRRRQADRTPRLLATKRQVARLLPRARPALRLQGRGRQAGTLNRKGRSLSPALPF